MMRTYLDNMSKPGSEGFGDLNKVIVMIFELSTLPEPPLRLFLGTDVIQGTRKQMDLVVTDLVAYEKWSDNLQEDPQP